MVTEVHDQASLVEVNVFKVCPACIATNDGGATPETKIQAIITNKQIFIFNPFFLNVYK